MFRLWKVILCYRIRPYVPALILISTWFFFAFIYNTNQFLASFENQIDESPIIIVDDIAINEYPKLTNRYFTPHIIDRNMSVLIYSAYIDFRIGNMGSKPNIRFMALAKTVDHIQLHCEFGLDDRISRVTVDWYETPEPHGASYAAYVLSCVIPEDIRDPMIFKSIRLASDIGKTYSIPISNYVRDQNSNRSFRHQHTVCVPTLFGSGYSQYHLIEFMEATRILGADYFVLYIYDADYPRFKRVLNYYQRLGRLTYLNLSLPIGYGTSWNYAQSLVVQDCLFRNTGYSRYLIFNDVDEYFVPYAADTWSQLSENHLWKERNRAGYAVPTFYFGYTTSDYPNPPITLKLRKSSDQADAILTKCLIRPERVFDQGIHHVSRVIQDHYLVDRMNVSIGALYHFKNQGTNGMEKFRLRTLMKKGNRLMKAYKRVIRHLNL